MQQCLTGARRVFEVLDTPVEVTSRQGSRAVVSARGDIRFEEVSFHYQKGLDVLKGLSFQAQAGSLTAILGATGSGKSALLSLIPRFFDPTAGRVLLDGCDLRDLELSSLRRQVGIVFQESFLFSTSIAENIAFGNPGASQAQIERAARMARAHDFILDMPEGYETRLFEAGGNLSGGQRQRLAIARALLLEPAVLLLDDPTSAIDPLTEAEILDAMENAMKDRTTFVVAHRLSTLRRADQILVLNHGKIEQIGSHQELLKAGGLYRRAVESQLPGEDVVEPYAREVSRE
jgi:ATP-binding cassette subfamily B protein